MHLKTKLEQLYHHYNHQHFVDPDPLACLYRFEKKADREIAGLIAASLAYGRVAQIMHSVEKVLAVMSPSPREYVEYTTPEQFECDFKGFVYRFAKCSHLTALLAGIKALLQKFGSMETCFFAGLKPGDETVMGALKFFYHQMEYASRTGHLLANPEKRSACKRLHLFLRWMIRSDNVDPGVWTSIPASLLVIPLDVHMHRCGHLLGLTTRNSADIGTALEITQGFRQLVPDDPVKYDFCLTRFGIRKAMAPADLENFLKQDGQEILNVL